MISRVSFEIEFRQAAAFLEAGMRLSQASFQTNARFQNGLR
jgi:hypothetical protein